MPTRSRVLRGLSLRQLELVALVAPLVFLVAIYALVLGPVHPVFHEWPGFLLLAVVLAVAVWMFTRAVFGAVRTLQHAVEALSTQTQRHNQQLMELHGADLALMRETRVEDALRRLVEIGARLSGACHAALVLDANGAGERVLVHPEPGDPSDHECAIETATWARAGLPATPQPGDLTVSVPLAHLGKAIGTLHLARGVGAQPFAPAEQEVARMFATHAALVVENDRVYDEVRVLAIEAERQALAREMHDSLAQVLAFVNTKAQAVELYLRDGQVPAARQQMAELSAAAREVYADIREGISALRIEVAGRGLSELVDGYAREFADSSGIDVATHWDAAAESAHLPPNAEVQLLRIVQEALSNVRRHAGATQIKVRAMLDGGGFELSVADDGRGFARTERPSDGRPRFGLQTMTERAAAVGGRLEVESEPGRGTVVRVRIPLPAHVDHGTAH